MFCACDPCAILFSERADGRYRRVPRRVAALANLNLADKKPIVFCTDGSTRLLLMN